MSTPNRIENFPVSFFAMIMGMSGLTIAWQKAAHLLDAGISSMKMFELTHKAGFFYLSWALLGLLSLVVGYLLFKTGKAVQNHKICLPEA